MRQIHLLWRDRSSCTGPMAYTELADMMSKALEQLQMFMSKVIMPLLPSLGPACVVHERLRWATVSMNACLYST